MQQPVHLNSDRCLSADLFGASGLPGAPAPQRGHQRQHDRRTNFGTTHRLPPPQQHKQHNRRFSLAQYVSAAGRVGGAMPRAPIESDLADDVSLFFGRPQQHVHRRRCHHFCTRTGRTSGTVAAAVAGRFRPQHRPHNRGRRFHAAAQHFGERPLSDWADEPPLPAAFG